MCKTHLRRQICYNIDIYMFGKDTTPADTAEDGQIFKIEHLILESDFEQCGVYWQAGTNNDRRSFCSISLPRIHMKYEVPIQAFVSESFGVLPKERFILLLMLGRSS